MKVEAQDRGVAYSPEIVTINRMGFFFNVQVPPVDVLCAMKFAAILARAKWRDFYDAIFLLSKTKPKIDFLSARSGVTSVEQLKDLMLKSLEDVDLNHKRRDFEHVLLNPSGAERIMHFRELVAAM